MTDLDIDKLRRQWQTADIIPNEPAGAQRPADTRPKVRESLRDRYVRLCLRMICVCLIGILISFELYSVLPTLSILLDCYFLVFIVFQGYSAWRAKRLDFGSMSACDAIRSVRLLERLRVVKRLVGLTLGLPLIIYLMVYMGNLYGVSYVTGCIGGAVIGCVLGYLINRHATGLLSSLREELGDDGEGERADD